MRVLSRAAAACVLLDSCQVCAEGTWCVHMGAAGSWAGSRRALARLASRPAVRTRAAGQRGASVFVPGGDDTADKTSHERTSDDARGCKRRASRLLYVMLPATALFVGARARASELCLVARREPAVETLGATGCARGCGASSRQAMAMVDRASSVRHFQGVRRSVQRPRLVPLSPLW